MDKEYFIKVLKSRIAYLEESELNKIINFYSNEIDNKIKSGMDEYTAVKDLGPIVDIISKIKNKDSIKNEEKAIEIVQQSEVEIEEDKKSYKKIILFTCPLWVIASILVVLLMIIMYLATLTLFFLGLVMFFATFTSLSSPFSTIIFGFGSGLGLFGLAILSIPLSLLVTKVIVAKLKKYYNFLKEELK